MSPRSSRWRTSQQRLASDGIALWLSHVRPAVLALLERSGALEVIGRDRVYPRIADGILAFAGDTAGARARIEVLADIVAYLRERRMQEGTSPRVSRCLRPSRIGWRRSWTAGNEEAGPT